MEEGEEVGHHLGFLAAWACSSSSSVAVMPFVQTMEISVVNVSLRRQRWAWSIARCGSGRHLPCQLVHRPLCFRRASARYRSASAIHRGGRGFSSCGPSHFCFKAFGSPPRLVRGWGRLRTFLKLRGRRGTSPPSESGGRRC